MLFSHTAQNLKRKRNGLNVRKKFKGSQLYNSHIKEQALNNYKNKNKWPVVTLYKLSVKHGLSLDWLITGKGPMRLDEKFDNYKINEITAAYSSTAEKNADIFNQVREILESEDDFVIKALRDRLKDYRTAIAMNMERRNMNQRLARIEAVIGKIADGVFSTGERRGDASSKDDVASEEAQEEPIGKLGM